MLEMCNKNAKKKYLGLICDIMNRKKRKNKQIKDTTTQNITYKFPL